jgi:hypothetical protein
MLKVSPFCRNTPNDRVEWVFLRQLTIYGNGRSCGYGLNYGIELRGGDRFL